MKLTIHRAALHEALRTVTPAAAAKAPAIPILAGVRIDVDTDGGTATFTCTSLDFTITTTLDGITAAEDEAGSAVAPARLLAQVVATLPAGTVQVGVYDGHLVVVAGDTEARLRLHMDEAWPAMPQVDAEPTTLYEQQLDDLRAVVGMASTDMTRASLTGVHFEGQRAFATDSYRLGAVDLGGDMPQACVPAAALATVLRAASDGVVMAAGDRYARFTAGNTSWVTTLIEADPPKVDNLINVKRPYKLAVERRALLAAVRRASSIGLDDIDAAGSGRKVHGCVVLAVDGDKLTVERRQADVGLVDDTLPCTSDWPGRIGFNPGFLTDLANAAGDEYLTIEVADELKPVITRSGRRTLLLMPVRVAS